MKENKMTETDIITMINDVFAESFEIPREKLQPEMKIFDDLGLDSLDIIDLVVALQKKFGVSIRDDERVREIRKLGDIYTFIIALKGSG